MSFRVETRINGRRGLARMVGQCTECKQVVAVVPLIKGSDGRYVINDFIEKLVWETTDKVMHYHQCDLTGAHHFEEAKEEA